MQHASTLTQGCAQARWQSLRKSSLTHRSCDVAGALVAGLAALARRLELALERAAAAHASTAAAAMERNDDMMAIE